jgi:N-acetylmuramoyl-L-alanine amidase
MKIDVQRKLLTVNPFSRPGKKLSGVKALVIHWVANAGSTAAQNRNYFESLKG